MKTLPTTSSRGMTLVEVLFAAIIMSGITMGIFSLLLLVLRQERSQTVVLGMSQQTAKLHRLLRDRTAISAQTTITASPPKVEFLDKRTTPNVVSSIEYEDGDGNPATIGDNKLVFYPDITYRSKKVIVATRVSQVADPKTPGAYLPYFRRASSASFATPLEVNLRMGDRNNPTDRAADDTAKKDDGVTGPGLQTFVIQQVFVGRTS